MKILIDAMGGDRAPLEILRGTAAALTEYKFTPILVGSTGIINACARENGIDTHGIGILHADNVIGMADPPMSVRSIPSSSLRVGLTALGEGKADAFVSAGNTGALQMGANLFVHRIPGVTRPAIGTILPFDTPVLLLDSGANATFSPELLCLYALTGSIYMKKVHGVKKPRVGLLNIGSEPFKGTPDHVQAHTLLSDLPAVNFVGNIEPTALPSGVCDVLVCDGFSGNVLLKTVEGISAHILGKLSEEARKEASGPETDIDRILKEEKKRFDPAEYGGAPLLGIAAPVIKAHGNSDMYAIKNAIGQAIRYARGKVTSEIARGLKDVRLTERD